MNRPYSSPIRRVTSSSSFSDASDIEIDVQPAGTGTGGESQQFEGGNGAQSVVEQLHEHQQQRANRLFHPMSSPNRTGKFNGFGHGSIGGHENSRGSCNHHAAKHHQRDGRVVGSFNRRNRHDILRHARERHREDRILLSREKTSDAQQWVDYRNQLENEADDLGLDLEQLIYDEIELQAEEKKNHPRNTRSVSRSPAEANPDGYSDPEDLAQKELEEYLRLEQQELEDMISQLELS